MAKDKHLSGRFELGGIPSAPHGLPHVEVTVVIDSNEMISEAEQFFNEGKKVKERVTPKR